MCFPSGFIKISWPVSRFDVFFSYNWCSFVQLNDIRSETHTLTKQAMVC